MHAGVHSLKISFVHVVGLAAFWTVAVASVYVGLPILMGREVTYVSDPLIVSAALLFWIGVTCCVFPKTSAHVFFENSLRSYGLLALSLAAISLFYAYTLPFMDPGHARAAYYGQFAGTFLVGGPEFFFVKSLEILLQQLLVAGLILYVASYKLSLASVQLATAALFGVSHVALLTIMSPMLTLVFVLASLCASVVFPPLILYVKNGFVYTYIIHWMWYCAVTVALVAAG